ncbi:MULTISPECIES: TetR/AcrR family transcriptional regulator [Actinomadura]|uniref:TetR/AcrR family transcriptional regulator n=2 Tax=Actinomadura yumaensis TaxID=111807 RepID=A0ABW2CSH4_9ACTN|nr:TetR family transcriptional regulator C-terminal domain-containing protein [Actinomadura sp. J1-007]
MNGEDGEAAARTGASPDGAGGPDGAGAAKKGGTTRGRLLEAAVELLAESGWAAVTSRVVADRAQVNNALVHYYFGTVDALRRAAVTHALEAELEAPVLAILQAENALDGLVAAITELAAGGAASPAKRVLAEAMVQGLRDESLRADTATQIRTFRELLAGRLAEDQAAGKLRADADPKAIAETFAALMDGLLLHLMADPGFDPVSATTALVAMLRPRTDERAR